MSVSRRPESGADVRPATADPSARTPDLAPPAPTPATDRPRSLEEAEERYVACRDAWTAAMRRANSGRPADLASLAITQEAYEHAYAEVERWRSGARIAIKIEPEAKRAGLEAAIGQEMAWRRVHETAEKQPGTLARLVRRMTGRR